MSSQNVVVSDAKSGMNMGLTVAVFPAAAAQKPPAVPGTYISISKKKLLQNLDINSTARISAWVDSMRASSPTHIKSQPLSEDHTPSNVNTASFLFCITITITITIWWWWW